MATYTIPISFQPGFELIDASKLNNILAFPKVASADGLTAHAGGGQTNATLITSTLNRLSTVVSAGDSVRLPPSSLGRIILISNDTATSSQVYGSGTDTINDTAYATGVALAGNTASLYFCPSIGKWYSLSGGSGGSSGQARTVTAESANFNVATTANTDFVYLCTGTISATMPTPSGSVNIVTIVNAGVGTITIVGTVNGTTNPTLGPGLSYDLIDNGSSYTIK